MAYQSSHLDPEETEKIHLGYAGEYCDSSHSPSETHLDPPLGSYYNTSYDTYGALSYPVHTMPTSQPWSTWDTLHSPTILPPHSQFSYWKDQASPGNVSSYSEILHSPTLYGNKSYASRPTLQTMMSAEDETKSPEPERRPKNQSKKFKCDWPSCTSAFARKADRDRHKYCVHQKDQSEKKDCPEPNCLRKGDQGFTRSDHLTEHLRNFHHKELPRRSRRGRPASSSIEAAP